jgi:ribosomal-protein-alanine N-acetyltransferase
MGRKDKLLARPAKSRVLIRPPELGDCVAFVAAVRRSRAFLRGWITLKAGTPAAYRKFLKRLAAHSHHGFLVIHRESGDLVGMIALGNIIRGNFKGCIVGYNAFLPHAGKGFMREGMRLVLRHAFRKLKLHRVEADIQPHNRRSRALARACGFVCEGLSRRMVKVAGRWRDHERWVILAEDFPVASRGLISTMAKWKPTRPKPAIRTTPSASSP